MPTQDTVTQLYTQLWTLINADNSWPIDPSNEIRYDTATGTQDPDREIKDDGDYPQARLWCDSGKSSLMFDDQTFGTHAADFASPWIEKQQYVFKLEVTSQLVAVTEIDEEFLEAIEGLRKGGPHLGLSFVRQWGVAWRNEKFGVDEPDQGAARWRATITITIDCELEGDTL